MLVREVKDTLLWTNVFQDLIGNVDKPTFEDTKLRKTSKIFLVLKNFYQKQAVDIGFIKKLMN